MGLLSWGSLVRVQPGAPFPKEFADFAGKKIHRRSFIEIPRPHVAGRRPHRQTRHALLREVGVWPAPSIGHAGRRREVHGHALPPVRRAARVSVSPTDGPERLRPATPRPSSSARTHARRLGPTHWRGRKGRHLPVGVEKENTVAGPLATRRGPGRSQAGRTPCSDFVEGACEALVGSSPNARI
jgi:hypothetical protein